jgi:hypothetical protein
MKYGVLIFTFLLLASCATMRNADTRPTESSCVASYDSGRIGEKEALAGTILLPGGLLFGAISGPLMAFGVHDMLGGRAPTLFIGGIGMAAIGGLSVLAGIVTLIDGHRRVNNWNKYCVGATTVERYCLFEPLIEQKQ